MAMAIQQSRSVILIPLLFLLIPLLWFALAVFLAIWVYRDAQARGMDPLIWLLVVLIGGIVGLVVYLVVRGERPVVSIPRPATNVMYCRYCGAMLPADAVYCSRCGRRQPQE